jgi:hypothetical protein
MTEPQSHRARPIVDELREMRDIARREHGPQARSTRLFEDALKNAERPPRDAGEQPSHEGRQKRE